MVDATGTFKLSNLMSTCFPESVTDTEVLRSLLNISFRSDGQSRITMTPKDGDITIWVHSARGSRSSGSAGGASSAGGIGILPWRESRPWQSSFTERRSDDCMGEAQGSDELEQEQSATQDVAPDQQLVGACVEVVEQEQSATQDVAPDQQPVGACVEVVGISDEDEEPSAGSHVEPPGRFWTVYEHEGTYWWTPNDMSREE